MGDFMRIVGVGIVVSVLLTFVRSRAPSIGVQLMAGFVVIVFMWALRPLADVVGSVMTLAEQAGLQSVYMHILLKAVGIAAVTSIGASLCRDMGENAIAQTVEMAGKVFIILVALPVVAAIVDVIVQLLPG